MFIFTNKSEDLLTTPPKLVTGGAGVVLDALDDRSKTDRSNMEYVKRTIFNTGAAVVYFAIDSDCSSLSYHGVIAVNGSVEIASLGRVSIYCASAWTVATLEQRRHLSA